MSAPDAERSPRGNEATAKTPHRPGDEVPPHRTNRLGRPRLAPLSYGYGNRNTFPRWCLYRDLAAGRLT